MSDADPDAAPASTPASADDLEPVRAPVRRRAAVAGVTVAAVAAVAFGLVAFTGDDSDAVATIDSASMTTVTTLPAATSTRPSTSVTTTTTTTTTLPRQESAPIAPPADPRGAEDAPFVGSIAIPKIGLDAAMHSGIRLTTLDQGPGHWPGTAMPGEIGNVVVAAHRTSHNAEFRYIDELDPGDEVVFSTDTGEHTYRVTGTEIVGPDAIWITNPTDTPTATLFACHPLGSTAKRIVVNLELVT